MLITAREFIQVDSLESPFHFERHENHGVVSFNPMINEGQWGTVMEVGHEILTHLENLPGPALVVDLSRLTYIGSPQVALLVRLWKSLKRVAGRMSVVCPPGTVRDSLSTAGLRSLWQIVETRQLALAAVGVEVEKVPAASFSPWNWFRVSSNWMLPRGSNRAG